MTNLAITQGDDATFNVTVLDETGATADPALWEWKAQIRRTTADADCGGPPAAEFTATVDAMVLQLRLSHGEAAQLTESSYRWDLQGTRVDTGWVTTFTTGSIRVTPEVTR